jgi:hypothetical protein
VDGQCTDPTGVQVVQHLIDDQPKALDAQVVTGLVFEAVLARRVALGGRQQDQGEVIAVHRGLVSPVGGMAAISALSASAACCSVRNRVFTPARS